MWVKEYSRTIDYLETRKDMQCRQGSLPRLELGAVSSAESFLQSKSASRS
jgi:hypothetical protein